MLKELQGGWVGDMMIGKNGAKIMVTALNFHSYEFDNIIKFQFYQKKDGEALLKIVPNKGIPALDENKILQEIQTKIGDNLEVTIEFVDDIQLSPRGKYKMIMRETEIQ